MRSEIGHLSGSQAGTDHQCETVVGQKVKSLPAVVTLLRGEDHYYTFRIRHINKNKLGTSCKLLEKVQVPYLFMVANEQHTH